MKGEFYILFGLVLAIPFLVFDVVFDDKLELLSNMEPFIIFGIAQLVTVWFAGFVILSEKYEVIVR